MFIDPSHPRATSLAIRERLVWGMSHGLTHPAGLLAHGRGEAFDYLLGEKTHPFAELAIEKAATLLLLAKHPTLSINGNAAALSAKEFITLAGLLNCKIEVNVFHYSKKRIEVIEGYLMKKAPDVVARSKEKGKVTLAGIRSNRKTVLREGIASADVVFVPLEDGDRTEALIAMGKKVITIDLNPLSRTAQQATVTIVDNITRALPLIIRKVKELKKVPKEKLVSSLDGFQNKTLLLQAREAIHKTLLLARGKKRR